MTMLNIYPRWKYLLIFVVLLLGTLYALPNIYGEDPAVQIKGLKTTQVNQEVFGSIQEELKQSKLGYKSIHMEGDEILIRFADTDVQLKAQERVRALLSEGYSVALNLAPVTPKWLAALGASPMKLGLDLRGGVRFVMEVDVPSAIQRRMEDYRTDIRNNLREERLRYSNFTQPGKHSLKINFSDREMRDRAAMYLRNHYPLLEITKQEQRSPEILIQLPQTQITEIRNYTVEQTVSTLRNRVNELGVAEAIVQRQGLNRVVVELPGIQDTARARDIIGKVATVDFVLVDVNNDVMQALRGRVPLGSRLLYERNGRPHLVKKKVILTGDSIVGASSGFSSRNNKPAVHVRVGGSGVRLFEDTTLKNIGKPMGVIYREVRVDERIVGGEIKKEKVVDESLISVATINDALSTSFEITGLGLEEARDLALLLRAGALPATIDIVEEHIIGPSMGHDNIEKGVMSLAVGLGVVLAFMIIYYGLFGLFADLALVFNLVLLVAIMSLLGATLTLPGIAGIVLTMGMAVDANVLIFERIREELRTGMTPQASIHRGFDQAFSTIVDANLTTLIVGVILFAVGTGPVKGFAVTLSIGILTSMFTAITGTRAIINFLYGGKPIQKISVGI